MSAQNWVRISDGGTESVIRYDFVNLYVHLCCAGNYYQKGRIRQQELMVSCSTLGIRQSNVFVLDHRFVLCSMIYHSFNMSLVVPSFVSAAYWVCRYHTVVLSVGRQTFGCPRKLLTACVIKKVFEIVHWNVQYCNCMFTDVVESYHVTTVNLWTVSVKWPIREISLFAVCLVSCQAIEMIMLSGIEGYEQLYKLQEFLCNGLLMLKRAAIRN